MMKWLFITSFILLSTTVIINGLNVVVSEDRSFTVDLSNNQFLMDGKPFRFIAGSFHYFRALSETWQRKLRTMRAAGLNTVTTYVEWSLHNPKDDVYNWEGMGNLVKFIELATEEDLYVILRPGPYICAERDMGGFPYWLLNKYPQIQLRTDDPNYLREVRIWYKELMTKMEPYLYGNGGPIILVQVENEYGSFFACNDRYKRWLRDETERYVKGKAVLFTNDGPSLLRCGKIPNVLAGLDFGAADNQTIDSFWSMLRDYEPAGPLINAEYYPGWLTHWQEKMQRVDTQPVIDSFEKMMADGANINFYMFFGGTNFGFTAGANDGGPGQFNSDVTSYDYDAPMDEAGDVTPKYMAIRESIAKFVPLPNIPVPPKTMKIKLPDLTLKPVSGLLDSNTKKTLGTLPVYSNTPLSFEALDQYSGFILYETILPKFNRDPVLLTVERLRDRAYIYVDRNFVGILERANNIYSLPISLAAGNKLQILVSNEGRINYGIPNDFKGILGRVIYGQHVLQNWTMTGYPLEDYSQIQNLISRVTNKYGPNYSVSSRGFIRSGPTVFHADFSLTADQIHDTYLDTTGWGKGIAFINGFNLGRYWPLVGPQITLYIPKELLSIGNNKLTLIELQRATDNAVISFSDYAKLDGFPDDYHYDEQKTIHFNF